MREATVGVDMMDDLGIGNRAVWRRFCGESGESPMKGERCSLRQRWY
jgi:hypothetical protein